MNVNNNILKTELHRASIGVASVRNAQAPNLSGLNLSEQSWFSESTLRSGSLVAANQFKTDAEFESVEHAVSNILQQLLPHTNEQQ